jgi:hypothetical protein
MEVGKNTNYWPGFVDALGNTIIAMVFVVIVLAVSLSMYAKLLAQRQAEKIVAQKLAEIKANGDLPSGGGAPVHGPARTARSRDADPSPEMGGHPMPTEVVEAREVRGKSDPTVPEVREQGGAIEVIYGREAFELVSGSKERFQGLVRKVKEATGNTGIEITVVASDLHFTETQRHAYLRAMILRNELIDLGFAPRLVTVKTRATGSDGEPMIARVVSVPGS